MTIPQWPFDRTWPSGLVDGDVPGGADLTKLDEKLSRAANGALWSDVALFRNITRTPVGDTYAIFDYEPVSGNWFGFGPPSASPMFGRHSFDDGNTWSAVGASFAADVPTCVANDGAGTIVLGYDPAGAGSSAQKAMWSNDGFATFTRITTGASNGNECSAVHYSPRLGLWMLALQDGSIWTCTTAGGTWVQRLAPNASQFIDFIESGDRIGLVGTAGSFYSLDGLAWVATSAPPIFGRCMFVPLPSPGKFLLSSTTTGGGPIYTSDDFLSWHLVTATAAGGAVAAYGRLVVGRMSTGGIVDLAYSLDLGASWKRLKVGDLTGHTSGIRIVVGGDRCVVAAIGVSDTIHYRGMGAGF